MELVDTHCHLQFPKLKPRLDEVIDRALSAGVKQLICVGTTLADSAEAVAIAGKYPNVWASVGIHPHDAKDFSDDQLADFAELIGKPKVVAVGEIGLDFYKLYSPKQQQVKVLRRLIKAGRPSGLPFIFHVRGAFEDFWQIFDQYPNLRGVVHSFSATQAEVEQILERNLYIGLNGIVTFSQDEAQLVAAKAIPKNHLVLETDAPFLTPQPYRGQVCEPKHIRTIAEFLAELRGESLARLATATTRNANQLFKLA